VKSGSPAATAGIKRGEIILEINQEQVESVEDFKKIIAKVDSDKNILFLTKRGEHTRFVVVKNK
ncbi:MAG: PDZ domain-containing protein, partial [Desulfurivibrionaceae bacterium]|nr:PDZ domain-containing protein [Desulfurivibrionaceae bacterium]